LSVGEMTSICFPAWSMKIFLHQNSFTPDADTLDILIFQQLREIIPRQEVSPLLTYSTRTDTVILSCVV